MYACQQMHTYMENGIICIVVGHCNFTWMLQGTQLHALEYSPLEQLLYMQAFAKHWSMYILCSNNRYSESDLNCD